MAITQRYSLKGGDNGLYVYAYSIKTHKQKFSELQEKSGQIVFIITGGENILLAITGKSNRKTQDNPKIKLNCLI